MTDIDVSALVLADRIHGRLYYDPAIFAQEQRRIWDKVWVYLGHESEIPARGDYVRRQLGLQPVILVRGADGAIRVLYNRCRHRANLVCHKDRGNAAELNCPYQGWTYATDGRLVAGWDEAEGGKGRVVIGRTQPATSHPVTFTREIVPDADSAQYPVVAKTPDGEIVAWVSGSATASVIRVRAR